MQQSQEHGSESDRLSAVILGAGVAGLLTASVACKHFDDVHLIDKDFLGGRVENETIVEVLWAHGISGC